MKWTTISKFLVASAAVMTLGACGNTGSNASSSSEEIVTDLITEDTTITFWHAMNGAQETALQKLTDDFVKSQPNYQSRITKPSPIF